MKTYDDSVLPDTFYHTPEHASTTKTTKGFRNLLLSTDGELLSHGVFWKIIGKRIGPGVYRITLEKK